MRVTLNTKSFPEEGVFQHSYAPLQNLVNKDGYLGSFRISRDKFPINVDHPISIECQPSYDGTVNLIISDDENPIKLINSRFTKIENNRFKIINRDQIEQTNIYKENNISSTNLVLTPNNLPKIKFKNIRSCGKLMGGNYTFYMKYVDGDGNESDFVAETFQIPVFKGTCGYPKTISGTLADERTDKAIVLLFTNLDQSFAKIKLYYSRETSDLNGFRISDYAELPDTFDINGPVMEILITGNEVVKEINADIINLERSNFTSAKTHCQQQNMLFLGNISKSSYDVAKLRNAALFFNVSCKQDEDVGWVDTDYNTSNSGEYYSPENICYRTGYWPSEFYRLGVVYIMEDGSHTDVFNLRGCIFDKVGDENLTFSDKYIIDGVKQNIPKNSFIDKDSRYTNTFGVFRMPSFDKVSVINYSEKKVRPLHYEIKLEDEDVKSELKACGVKGYFFVRQKRIPIILFQGLSLDVDQTSGSPMLWDGNNYFTESFLRQKGGNEGYIIGHEDEFFAGKTISETQTTGGSVLISPDASFIPDVEGSLFGSNVHLEKLSETIVPILNKRNYVFGHNNLKDGKIYNFPAVFVNENIPYKIVNDYQFSTRFGNAESVKDFRFFGKNLNNEEGGAYLAGNTALLRGIYTSYVGICGKLEKQCLYNVRAGEYSSVYNELYMLERGSDHSAFFRISNTCNIGDIVNVWSGDCYSNTVTMRLTRNFTDPDAPINDYILSPSSWKEIYTGYLNMSQSASFEEASKKEDGGKGDWFNINRGDVNSAPLGLWVTFKLLSSYNLGLRSEDRLNVQEMTITGSPRSFYPISGMSTLSNAKMSDSMLLNLGYSSTVSAKEYYETPDVPYLKEVFDNRIMYSNLQVKDEFKNGYRIFAPMAYKDIDRQYGAIVKLLPWNTNLLCVFEHGIGIIPINEKALLSTLSGQSIHLYGAGVLQDTVSLVSDQFGSIWQDSIIKTDIGVYGVDTYAKKIWRLSSKSGFESLSDIKIQRFLNDNMLLSEGDTETQLSLLNIKTHYNAHKGDVIFTFYNYNKGVEWSVCYNERVGKWVTRYSWIPICSDNINNCYFSFDKKRAELLGYINNLNSSPITISKPGKVGYFWDTAEFNSLSSDVILNESFGDKLGINIVSAETSYLNEKDEEIKFFIDSSNVNKFCHYFQNKDTQGVLQIDPYEYSEWWNSNFDKWEDVSQYDENLPDEFFDSSEGIEYTPIPLMPLYLKLNVELIISKDTLSYHPIKKSIVILPDPKNIKSRQEEYDKLLINGLYVHGRAGIFDEMDYTDNELYNQILPTKWYDKQEPFEFEFVVNSPVGLHKIFDNLVIISNNVQPNSIEYTIEGDTYSLFKDKDLFNNNKKRQLYLSGVGFKNAKLNYDTILNQYSLTIHQDCKNMADPKFGRRLGNIQYKEDSWYATIEPLIFDPLLKASPDDQKAKWTSTRIRDKFLKVRVKYTGEDLVIITAIKNLCTLSRA